MQLQGQRPVRQWLSLPVQKTITRKMKKSGKEKPQSRKQSSQPKARETFDIPVVQQVLESPRFLKRHKANTDTSMERQ